MTDSETVTKVYKFGIGLVGLEGAPSLILQKAYGLEDF